VVQLGHQLELGAHHQGRLGRQLEGDEDQPGDRQLLGGDHPAGGGGDARRHAPGGLDHRGRQLVPLEAPVVDDQGLGVAHR
jgi:hypothetical protein